MLTAKNVHPKLIRLVLWAILFYSVVALTYHIRWFIPYLITGTPYTVPHNQLPLVWFIVQILTNVIFLSVGVLLLRLFRRFKETGYFGIDSLKAFNGVIISCIALALLTTIRIIANNIHELNIQQWTSLDSVGNLLLKSFTNLLVLREPQSMYLLLAITLWAVKQFVTKALFVKSENETFI